MNIGAARGTAHTAGRASYRGVAEWVVDLDADVDLARGYTPDVYSGRNPAIGGRCEHDMGRSAIMAARGGIIRDLAFPGIVEQQCTDNPNSEAYTSGRAAGTTHRGI